MPRALSDSMLEAFKTGGLLAPVLALLEADYTLDLQFRANDVATIYYRGGKLTDLRMKQGTLFAKMDANYFNGAAEVARRICAHVLPPFFSSESVSWEIGNADAMVDWMKTIPHMKMAIDLHFAKKSMEEREIQQRVVRENNYAPDANATDYFIVDVEYSPGATDDKKSSTFDMIAFQWPSKGHCRSNPSKYKPRLAIIEVKYAQGAMSNLAKHIHDAAKFVGSPAFEAFKEDMLQVFAQKRALGLIPMLRERNGNPVEGLSSEKPECLLLLANYSPNASTLESQLQDIAGDVNDILDVRLVRAHYMGYGLYMKDTVACR